MRMRNDLVKMTAVAWAVLASGVVRAQAAFPVTCVGRPDAAHQAIFLHGKRPVATSVAAAGHVTPLAKFAAEMDYRIAIPVSTTPCEDSRSTYCWRGERVETLQRTWSAVVKSASACFDPEQGFGLIGFSNGGYHAAKVVMRGVEPAPRWAVAIGSAGTVPAGVDLRGAPPLALLIGNRDVTRRDTAAFARNLAPTRLPVELLSFPGGHEVPFELLKSVVEKLSKPGDVAKGLPLSLKEREA
jgi:predicted esterase